MKLDRAIAYPVKYINTSITADLRVLVGRVEHRGSLQQLAFNQHFPVRADLDPRGPEDTIKETLMLLEPGLTKAGAGVHKGKQYSKDTLVILTYP